MKNMSLLAGEKLSERINYRNIKTLCNKTITEIPGCNKALVLCCYFSLLIHTWSEATSWT